MPETVACAHCRGTVGVPDELAGGPITCPYCRAVFVAPMSLPPEPPPKPVDPFAFPDAAETGDEEVPERRRRPDQKPKMTLGAGIVVAVVVAVAMVGMIAKNSLPKKNTGGFDFTQVAVAGLIGGVFAGGVGLMRYFMTQEGTRRKEYRKPRGR